MLGLIQYSVCVRVCSRRRRDVICVEICHRRILVSFLYSYHLYMNHRKGEDQWLRETSKYSLQVHMLSGDLVDHECVQG